jgi:hypothetical protein
MRSMVHSSGLPQPWPTAYLLPSISGRLEGGFFVVSRATILFKLSLFSSFMVPLFLHISVKIIIRLGVNVPHMYNTLHSKRVDTKNGALTVSIIKNKCTSIVIRFLKNEILEVYKGSKTRRDFKGGLKRQLAWIILKMGCEDCETRDLIPFYRKMLEVCMRNVDLDEIVDHYWDKLEKKKEAEERFQLLKMSKKMENLKIYKKGELPQ